MKHIKLLNVHGEYFKGFQRVDIDFTGKTIVKGANATGKTSLFDLLRWILFGTDSQGRTDFQIRPVDEYGNMVDNVEIVGEATLEVDGTVTILRKVQSQVWTKKRGSTAPTFSGNKNEMEIDGFPVSQKDYEAKIAEILPEDLFRLMTDPMAFTSMPWKEQREILLRFVSEITDKDVLELDEARFEPVKDDILAAGAELARDKAMAALKRLKEEQKGYPVRIDEVMRSIVQTGWENDLLKQKQKVENTLKEIQSERDNLSDSLKAVTDIQTQIMQVKMGMNDVKSDVEETYRRQKHEFDQAINAELVYLKELEREHVRKCDMIALRKKEIADGEAEIAELAAQYRSVKSRVMPEDETTCPTCGRPFDADKIAEIEKAFADRKTRDMGRISGRGKSAREVVDSAKDDIEVLKAQAAELSPKIKGADEKYKQLSEKAKSLKPADYTQTAEYKILEKKMSDLNAKLATLDNGDAQKQALRERESAAQSELNAVNAQLATIEANKRSQARIDELKAEQRDCGQKVADAEQALYLIEEFTKLKMDTLSERINSHFSKVRFKLFKTLINGAVQPTCVCQVATNGSYVDFPNVNHAGQIAAGLDIIGALGSLYDVCAPVWIDNSEALDSNNTPEVQSQLILLKVSDDPELTVSNM